MCGRFTLIEELITITDRFEALPLVSEWKPHYNIAPSQPVLAVISEHGKRDLVSMTFGFIPHWAKQKQTGYSMINAKAETVSEKPSFRQSFRNKRCLIPADGFYEWQCTKTGKLPYRFCLKNDALFAFAGIWDSWSNPEGKTINSLAIITTDANVLSRQMHDRMPVILHRKDEALWLDQEVTQPEKLLPLLVPYPADEMKMYRVSPKVNSWRNDSPDCIKPLKKQIRQHPTEYPG